MDGIDFEVYLFIDSHQLEATVGSYDLFISFHVLGSIDVMLQFIHAIGSLKLSDLVPVHACMYTTNHYGVCMWYVPTLAYLWYLVRTPPPPVRRHHQIAALGRDP
jgi:hypothetical protein